MDKAFNHKAVEEKIYKMWEAGGYFKPEYAEGNSSFSGEYFSVILPPPNANAPLHLGHAMYAIEDVLIRWHRLKGDACLWLPGSDHAGFETQVVYEKHLAKEGKSRFDFERSQLYKDIWDFVQGNKHVMESQVRRLGFSLDWDRMTFTLDDRVLKTVYKTFNKLWNDGLLYREARLVNYCTKHGTGFSDLEVEHEERDGFLYYMNYEVVEDGKVKGITQGGASSKKGKSAKSVDGGVCYLSVATARPETIPGDVALAVNPKDKRYKSFVGKSVVNPLNGRVMPVVADDFVKLDFGTGVVKITPAHDENDFQAGKRHKLEAIQVVGLDGKMTKEAGEELVGLKVAPAREKAIELLKRNGAFLDARPYRHTVAACYKCGTVLEPLPVSQWYVKTNDPKNSLAKKAIEAVKTGIKGLDPKTKKPVVEKITIVPKRFEKVYFDWLENIRDWNISRQITWGISIPAWKCLDCSGDEEHWVVTSEVEKDEKLGVRSKKPVCDKCGGDNLVQDTDTFDTWFSSGQWPFATLGFDLDKMPSSLVSKGVVSKKGSAVVNDVADSIESAVLGWEAQSADFKKFYPTSVMETGYDILFFWVARMVMLGIYATGRIPFRTVYLHGLVRDSKGQKMSKSKGNVVNPMDLVDKYGADAVRMALIVGTGAGNDQNLSEPKIVGYRNFANKVWNIGRFIYMGNSGAAAGVLKASGLKGGTTSDEALWKGVLALEKKVTSYMEKFRLSDAGEAIYQFMWHEIADKYIEENKERLLSKDSNDTSSVVAKQYLLTAYTLCLKLLHPFMPFVTEEVWGVLGLGAASDKPLIAQMPVSR